MQRRLDGLLGPCCTVPSSVLSINCPSKRNALCSTIEWVKGRQRTGMLSKYILDLDEDVEKVMAGIGGDFWEVVLCDMGST